MEITFLGTGTSQGVPVIGCDCPVCTSFDPRDNRLRSSILIEYNGKNICIDSGPDFRQQMLREDVQKLDAILYTHEHKDHIAGTDDIRAFNFKQKTPMPMYCSKRVLEGFKKEFHYVFSGDNYPGIPQFNIQLIDKEPFEFAGIPIIPIEVMHHKLPVTAFRIKDFTYITDANYVADEEFEKIKGTKVLVLNALRKTQHISHFSLDEALEFIDRIQPERAYLTHISHYFGLHEQEEINLPSNVFLAYDGLHFLV
ncbi:MAG: MBL fold metallo-hydrolase [Crocinitomicaceae bacterium]